MMKTYSHVRRLALDDAAAVLEPTFAFHVDAKDEQGPTDVTSQVTSQPDAQDTEIEEFLCRVPRPR